MSLTKVSPYITKAIETAGPTMLSLDEFVRVTGFPIDGFMRGFYANLDNDVNIYVTEGLIEWCGFGATEFRKKKMMFVRIIEQFIENEDYWIYNNAEYADHYALEKPQNSFGYPHPMKFNKRGMGKTKHIILTTDCFREILMMLNTKKALAVRKHYIQLEKLIILYMKYQCEYLRTSFSDTIDKLNNLDHVKEYSRVRRIEELDISLRHRYRVGVIYFIHEEGNENIVKIGYTFKLKKRLFSLQSANHRLLIVKKYYFSLFPQIEEMRLHNKYKDSLVRGEWYQIL